MRLSIYLQSVWRLWPLLTWEWFYFGWRFCDQCNLDGHETKRSLTVRVELPFAQIVCQPGIAFKTSAAAGCPMPEREAVAA